MLSIFLLSPVAMERTVIRRATVAKPGRSRWTLVPCTFYLRTSSAVSPAIIRERFAKEYRKFKLVLWIHPSVQRVRSHMVIVDR